MRLSHQGTCRIADTVTWHIAETFGGDGERMGCNGDIAQRCHNHGAHNLCSTHQDILNGHRNTDLAGMMHIALHPAERFLVLSEIQNPVSACRNPEIRQRDAEVGHRRTTSRSHHAHLHDIDEEIVEDDIADAYQHRHHTRCMHVACRLEHHLGDVIEEHKGQHKAVYQEIPGGIRRYVVATAQPVRQISMNAHAHQGKHQTERQAAYQGMAIHLACLHEIVGTDEVSHLHRETRGSSSQQTAYKPGG